MARNMQFDTILPEGFDGTFRFTNASEEDFVGKWGGNEYLYPARKTTPMVIYDATPLETQNIRKKFAKDYAVREFFKSLKGKALESQEKNPDGSARFNSIHQAPQYNESDLAPYIQQCLEPLEMAVPQVAEAPKMNIEENLSRDEEGDIRTQVVTPGTSLKEKALRGQKHKATQ